MKLTERLAALRTHDDDDAARDAALRTSAERLRSEAVASELDPFSADPAEARVHITADAELIIDLRPAAVVDGPAATTDMPCPNCHDVLRVDHLDSVTRTATMSCFACGFTFAPRLSAPRR